MAEVFPLDVNDQIDDEDLSDNEFEEVGVEQVCCTELRCYEISCNERQQRWCVWFLCSAVGCYRLYFLIQGQFFDEPMENEER